jgi:riboflavin kinase/FMN adenylyltransferase
VQVFSAPRLKLSGEPISSTRIRAQLEAGELASANSLLGYPYFAEGVVTPGKQLGRMLGFPTLNLDWSPDLRPRLGVYAVRVSGAKTTGAFPAVANYGLRPTVEQAASPRLEAHLLGECPFGAGDAVKVEWLSFLRPERKFADVEALRGQVEDDRRVAERFFGG